MAEEVFTVKEILVKLDAKVDALSQKLDAIDRQGSIGTREELIDHENRIRTLEGRNWRLAGGTTVIAAIAGVVSGFFGPHL